jgi:hypothetical protein
MPRMMGETRSFRRPRGVVSTAIFGLLLCASGCAPVLSKASFNDDHFSSGYGYDVSYRGGNKQLLPEQWQLDNYRLDRGQMVLKERDEYVTRYDFDNNEDGRIDVHLSTFTYVLRYENRVNSGVIWLRNIPLPDKLRSKDLRVLMQSYIDQLNHTTYERVRLGMYASEIIAERRYAGAVVEQGPATVAGQSAYVATIDIADTEQVKVTPDARTRRIQLVLMRAPQDELVSRSDNEPPHACPVVVLAGYSNMPADFAADLHDFHGFLGQLTIGGKAGLTLEQAPAAPTPDSTAPATAASAAH